MKVVPVAYDSMGVRSMATYVETPDIKVFIDPSAALGPKRYGLPPTEEEYRALELHRENIRELASRSDVIVVTHYHYDHHPHPGDSLYSVFQDKIVLAKDYRTMHASGKERGKAFEEEVEGLAKELIWADGQKFEFGKTEIEISPQVWHGSVGSRVGHVVMVRINEFVHGSDAQSLADPKAREWVREKRPRFLIVDGYPTIFVGWRMSKKGFEEAKEGLKQVLMEIKPETIIFDHHGVRDPKFREKMDDFWGLPVKTAAEYLGLENLFLEAWRKEIHEGKRRVELEDYFRRWKRAVGL